MSGFISSGFSVGAGGNPIKGAFQMAIIGGTVSELGGGKFANGAMSSAFQYLLNDTFQIGLGVNGGAGASSSSGFAVGHDSSQPWYKGWSFGMYGTSGGGIMAGTDASIVVDLGYSKNDTIYQLRGSTITVGGSAGMGAGFGYETNVPINSDTMSSQIFSIGLYGRAVPIPVESHTFLTSTIVE